MINTQTPFEGLAVGGKRLASADGKTAAAYNPATGDVIAQVAQATAADVDNAVVEALKKGGKVLRAPTDATKIGRIAVVQDPDGNAIGLYAPIKTPPPTQ